MRDTVGKASTIFCLKFCLLLILGIWLYVYISIYLRVFDRLESEWCERCSVQPVSRNMATVCHGGMTARARRENMSWPGPAFVDEHIAWYSAQEVAGVSEQLGTALRLLRGRWGSANIRGRRG